MAPRRTPGPRPNWGGHRRKGDPRRSSGGSPSRAAGVAGAAVAPSSSQSHREPSSRLPVGHASSAVVAKVAVGHSSASSSSGDFSSVDEVSTSSLQPPCMSSPSGCPPQLPGLATCVADADGADAVVGASSGNPSAAAIPSSLPEEEEPLSSALRMEVALQEEEEEPLSHTLQRKLQMEVALQNVVARFIMYYLDAHKKGTFSTDQRKSMSPALKMEVAIEVLFQLDLARKKRILSAGELDLIIHLKSQLPCLEEEVGEVNALGADVEEEEEAEVVVGEEEEFIPPSRIMQAALKIMFRLDLAREMRTLSADELDLYDDMKSLLPSLEAEIGEDNVDGVDVVEEEDNTDGADAVEEEEEPLSHTLQKEAALQLVVAKFMLFYFDAHEKRLLSTDEVKSIPPALKMEVAIEVLFQLDLARKKRTLSANELDLIIHLKSQLPDLEEIGEINAHGADAVEEDDDEGEEEAEPLSLSRIMQAALKIRFRLDLAREMRTLSADELDLYDDMKSLLPSLEAEIREDNVDGADVVEEEDNADGADAVEEEEEVAEEEEPLWHTLQKEAALQLVVAKFMLFYFDAHEKRLLSTDEVKSIPPALKMEVAIEVLFQLDLARKKRTLSANELDLIIHLKSQLPDLEEIGEINAHGADAVEEDDDEGEEEAEPLSLSRIMQAALKIMFRLDLTREMRTLSADELDLYDDMKSLLPSLEAEIREDNVDGADVVEEEDNADGADAVEEEEEEVVEEEEPLWHTLQKEAALQLVVAKFMLFYFDAHEKRLLSTDEVKSIPPALKMEVAIEVLFQLDLARKKRTLSANELDLIIHLKSQLPDLEEIGEINAHGADAVEEEEEEGEPLSPSRIMHAALKIMFCLDLAREMRTLSADELDLYDDMKSPLPSLEAEIREVATAPSIALEDHPSCQLKASSVALAGANQVPSPMVPGASTYTKLSADLQLAERSIIATNAELSTPGPEATPSVLKSSAEPEPAVEDDEITEALYRHSARLRRLPIFRDICPE